ncbi:conserved hypothetical protein [Alteromonas sp. 38]|nr:conserved hypothetical protein [Alteromonas sp. 154]VXC52491.1 conserved hypothetical protein [Alteromonas sp. 38]
MQYGQENSIDRVKLMISSYVNYVVIVITSKVENWIDCQLSQHDITSYYANARAPTHEIKREKVEQ